MKRACGELIMLQHTSHYCPAAFVYHSISLDLEVPLGNTVYMKRCRTEKCRGRRDPDVLIYLSWKSGCINGQRNVIQVPPSFIHKINVKPTFQISKGRRGEIVPFEPRKDADLFPRGANTQGTPNAGRERGVNGTQIPSRANSPAGFKSNEASFHEEC